MKFIKVTLALLLTLCLCLSAAAMAESAYPYSIGDTVDDFSLTLSTGEEVRLSELLKSYDGVLINIWASWCGPCRAEFPYLQEAYAQMKDDIYVLAVSSEPGDSAEVINAYKQKNGLDILPMAADKMGFTSRFGADSIPTSIMIDRNGVICYRYQGAILSTDIFTRLFEPFTVENYQTDTDFKIPGTKSKVEAPDAAAVSANLSCDASPLAFYFDAQDARAWPWIPESDGSRDYISASNVGTNASTARVFARAEVETGDVLAFDLKLNSEAHYDNFVLYVDGLPVKYRSGASDWTSYAYAFDRPGSYELCFEYAKDDDNSAEGEAALLDNVFLARGEIAADYAAALPGYPRSLERGVEILPAGAQAREIRFESERADALELIDLYLGKCYIVFDDAVEARLRVGRDVDPETALIADSFSGHSQLLSQLEFDDDAFRFDTGVDTMDASDYSYTSLVLYPNVYIDKANSGCASFFADEANANHFVEQLTDNGAPVLSGWHYVDAAPEAAKEAQSAPEAAAPESAQADYALYFVDQDANPVAGVVANLCSDSSCQPLTSDADGVIRYTGAPFAYHVQIIVVPEGYDFDRSAEYSAPEAGGEMRFELTRK